MAPYRLENIGGATPVGLWSSWTPSGAPSGRPVEKRMVDMQSGDVPATWADASLLEALTGYQPTTPVEEGVARVVDWFRSLCGV